MVVIGHRGARFEAPENTLAGFEYALHLGLRHVEFDVRLTKDDQIVVIHDATVDRTTNGTGDVAAFTFDEIRTLDARSDHKDWPEPVQIPTLAEVLDVIQHLGSFELEIKKDTPERLDRLVPMVLEAVQGRTFSGTPVVTSFEPYALELVQKHAPDQPRGFIGAYDSPEFLEVAKKLGCVRACIPYRTGLPELVSAAQAAGMTVTGWPTNTREEFDEALRRGVDGICTDSPTQILEWLKQEEAE